MGDKQVDVGAAPEAGRIKVSPESITALRRDMMKFAAIQIRDHAVAEDLVHDAMEVALRNADSYVGASSLKTWVFAILKNKIIDHLRQASRWVPISNLVAEGEQFDDVIDSLFRSGGGWRPETRPATVLDPEAATLSREFWLIFETCLEHLSENTARVFMMREFLGFESTEICQTLGLTQTNCYVMLHRARLKLQRCLETTWGGAGQPAC